MAAKIRIAFALLLHVCCWPYCAASKLPESQTYRENLFMRQLPDGKVMSFFRFKTTWNIRPEDLQAQASVRHYGMFPKSLGQIISHYDVQEVHVSLTQGQWRTTTWGYSPRPRPVGAELWAWFMPGTNTDEQWNGLANALSGLICASLNFINPTSTFKPTAAFRPLGALLGNLTDDRVRYAALPRETVCTENFTPWKKLLPCDDKAGLAQLFSVKKIYNSHYHSLGLDYYPECSNANCDKVFISLELSLLSVTDPADVQKWSFLDVFGISVVSSCPVAEQSTVWIHKESVELSAIPSSLTTDSKWAVYQLDDFRDGLTVTARREDSAVKGLHHSPPLWAHRYITGSGQEWGGLEVQLHNHHSRPLRVTYMDMVPWFLRLYLHTLRTTVVSEKGSSTERPDHILRQHYIPAKDRERSHMLELLLHLPPHSTTTLSVEFDRAFLRWNEHPPDAHHGFYVNSAVVTAILDTCGNCTLPVDQMLPQVSARPGYLLHLFTEPLLVQLPTPDFSMMFNVICFVSTVVAIAFGSLHNLTTRVLVPMETNSSKRSFFKRLFTFGKKVKNE